jgi:hypothetical protein
MFSFFNTNNPFIDEYIDMDYGQHNQPEGVQVGGVVKNDDSILFFPGSISNAMETGSRFTQSIKEETGITPSFINTQMSISQYPAQFLCSSSAISRNKSIIHGVDMFVRESSSEKIHLIGHSAGSREILQFLPGYKGNKEFYVTLIGPGTPYGKGYEDYLSKVRGMPNVRLQIIVNDIDFVPNIGGIGKSPDGERVIIPTEMGRELEEKTDSMIREPFQDITALDDQTKEFESMLRVLNSSISLSFKSHYVESYIRPVVDKINSIGSGGPQGQGSELGSNGPVGKYSEKIAREKELKKSTSRIIQL